MLLADQHVYQTPLERACAQYALTINHPNGIDGTYWIWQRTYTSRNPDLIAYFSYDNICHEWTVRANLWGDLEAHEGGPKDWQRIALHCIQKQFGLGEVAA